MVNPLFGGNSVFLWVFDGNIDSTLKTIKAPSKKLNNRTIIKPNNYCFIYFIIKCKIKINKIRNKLRLQNINIF